MRPHQPDKTRLSPKRHNQWRGWVTHVRIDENPVNKGDTISALTRRAKETASRNVLRWSSKNDSNKGLCRCQNRRISGRGSRTVRQGRMVTGDKGHFIL